MQVKGGSASWPTDEDVRRLRQVARLHKATAVVLSVWKKGSEPDLYELQPRQAAGKGRRGWWGEPLAAEEIFGRSAAARQAGT